MKYPRISGAYTKPEGFPGTECFHPACRESKCWCSAKLYNHALSKKKTTSYAEIRNRGRDYRSAFSYGLEINGFRVGLCKDISIKENHLTLTEFIEMDTQGYLKKWTGPRSISLYSYTPDLTPGMCQEFFGAEISHKWLGRLEITYKEKRTRRF